MPTQAELAVDARCGTGIAEPAFGG